MKSLSGCIRLLVASVCAAALLAACSGSSSSSSPMPVSVSLSPSQPQTVAAGQTINITASVVGTSNSGVTWSLSGAGSLANSTATSVSYQAPATVSTPAAATVTATAVADSTKSASLSITVNAGDAACGSGSEAKLNGSYAFLFQGFNSSGYVAMAGQFTANGAGQITAGQEDITTSNSATGTSPLQLGATGSSYTLGSDNRGCLTLATSAGPTLFRFSVGSSNGTVFTRGNLIEFDDATGSGQRGAGLLRLQDPSAFSPSSFTGNFAFGGSGVNDTSGRFAIAGVVDLSGGLVTGGVADADDGGTVLGNQTIASGTYAINSSTGRGALTFALNGANIDFALYVVNTSEAIVLTTDQLSFTNPIAAGVAKLQSGSFTANSLSGDIVLHDTALGPTGPIVVLGVLAADGVSQISGPTYNDVGGNNGTAVFQESYAVASNGRVILSGAPNPPVFYLYGTNEGFEVGSGPDSSFGFLENQSAGPFTNASFSGQYFFGPEDPADGLIQLSAGQLTANGASASPSAAGTGDESGPLGLAPGVPLSASYSIGSNGIGTITFNGAPGTTTAILISPTKLVYFENGNSHPVILVVQQ